MLEGTSQAHLRVPAGTLSVPKGRRCEGGGGGRKRIPGSTVRQYQQRETHLVGPLPAPPRCPHQALLDTKGITGGAFPGEASCFQETEPGVPGPFAVTRA